MISLRTITVIGPSSMLLEFSDDSSGMWSADAVISCATVLTLPLGDPEYFRRAFIDGDGLAWPNGLEFSAISLHRRLDEGGLLVRKAA